MQSTALRPAAHRIINHTTMRHHTISASGMVWRASSTRLTLRRSPRYFLLRLIPYLCLLLLGLNACKVGDVGSSSSDSSATATTDNPTTSTTDNSIHGSTTCTVTLSETPTTGVCTFTRECDGAEVSSGDFPPDASGNCVLPTPTPTPVGAAAAAPTP